MKKGTTLIIICIFSASLFAQKTDQFSLPTGDIKTIVVANIAGDVVVKGANGQSNAVVNARYSKDKSKSSSVLRSMTLSDTLLIYVDHPCAELRMGKDKNRRGWHDGIYQWTRTCDIPHETIDIDISMPSTKLLTAQTINDGDVRISHMSHVVKAKNINGSIHIDHVRKVALARTINGEVLVDFTTNPQMEGEFYSLNGDVEILLPDDPDLIVSFKSNYGDLYTSYSNTEALSSTPVRHKSKDGTKVRLEGRSRFKIGAGGRELRVETFNGNVYIKESDNTF